MNIMAGRTYMYTVLGDMTDDMKALLSPPTFWESDFKPKNNHGMY